MSIQERKIPRHWPENFIYTPLPISLDLHPAILDQLLATGRAEDQDKIHPLLEAESVHPALEIRKLEEPHLLAGQWGIFANEAIPVGTDIGAYSGEIRLIDAKWRLTGSFKYTLQMQLGTFWLLIDAHQHANELAFINDYRNLADRPNLEGCTIIHRGRYWPQFRTSRTILPGEELLLDYGIGYWNK